MDDSSTEIPKLTDTAGSSELSGKIMLFSVVTLMAIIIFILSFHFYARLISRHLRDHSAATSDNRRLRHVDISGLCHRGLSPSLIKLIPTFLYSSSSTATPDCAVCLSEFEEGETGRVLPGCRHSFHVECIDAWFRSHSSCPLCRAPVKPKAPDRDSGEVFVPVGYGVVVESSGPGRSVECGCSSAAVVLMVPVECRRKSVDFVAEPAALWVSPVTTASSLPV